jgi:lambda family phage portal protein
MSLITSIAEKVFRAAGATEASRSYASAGQGRLVGDWTTQNNSANQEIKPASRILRARSRQLARDDDYFIGFLKTAESNVIGTNGLTLQVKSKKKPLNERIEADYKDFSRKQNYDVTGQSSRRDMSALALRTLLTDGEFLMRKVVDPRFKYKLKLQMLDIDWLDEDLNDPKHYQTGNRIIMSVEVDQYDKPVAYWFTEPRWATISVPGTPLVPNYEKRLRIPAEQIIHRFTKERVGQMRGVPVAHGAMLRMNMLGGYEEAELVGARVGAANMAFVTAQLPEGTQALGTVAPPIETEVVPGQVLELPPGYTVHDFSPSRPGSNYADYIKSLLRPIAVSLGVSYNTFTSDLESVNYSSLRAGTINERDLWKILQKWVGDHLEQDIYETWLMLNSQGVPVTQLDQVMYPIWRARGFDWVDPSKDVSADTEALNRGFTTLTKILGEKGEDFEETMLQLAEEKKFIESLGLEFTSPDAAAKLAADAKNAEADKEEKDAKDKDSKAKAEKK